MAGARFCTAALVTERVIATAAHCLYHPRTRERVALRELRFAAGFRLGRYAARRRVVRAAVADGFEPREAPEVPDLASDVALLELDIAVDGVEPFAVGAAGQGPAAVVFYGRDRPEAPSIAEPCTTIARAARVAALDCGADFGASGAPVIEGAGEARRLVGVVSAIGRLHDGAAVTLAVAVAPVLAGLAAELGVDLAVVPAADPGGDGRSGAPEGLD